MDTRKTKQAALSYLVNSITDADLDILIDVANRMGKHRPHHHFTQTTLPSQADLQLVNQRILSAPPNTRELIYMHVDVLANAQADVPFELFRRRATVFWNDQETQEELNQILDSRPVPGTPPHTHTDHKW